MKQISLTTFILNFVIIGNVHALENQKVTQEENEQSASNTLELNPETTNLMVMSSTEQKIEKLALDPIITQAINFSNKIGDWFEDLFDKNQHMSFNAHVNDLGKIITAMHMHIIKPFEAKKNRDAITLAAYNLTSILYARAKTTYDILETHRNSPGFMKISNALKKVEKKFKSEQEKSKLKKAFKELDSQFIVSDPALCKKINQLELVVADNSTRTKKKGWWALAWGLRHRLQCK